MDWTGLVNSPAVTAAVAGTIGTLAALLGASFEGRRRRSERLREARRVAYAGFLRLQTKMPVQTLLASSEVVRGARPDREPLQRALDWDSATKRVRELVELSSQSGDFLVELQLVGSDTVIEQAQKVNQTLGLLADLTRQTAEGKKPEQNTVRALVDGHGAAIRGFTAAAKKDLAS